MSAVRYLLLLLCLSLSPSPSSSVSEPDALLSFKKSLSNPSQILPSWKPNSNPCEAKWQAVFCAKGGDGNPVVIRLHLQNLGLSGSIDINALNELKNLISLSISKNSFEGPLPPFNKLKGLKSIYLDSNKFSGEIPEDYFDGTNLRRIWFSNNQFSGKIPESLAKLPNLNVLHLEGNKFSGPIPDISQKSLTELDLSGNQLEGQVPQSMERFGSNAFKENSGVCGKLVGTECKEVQKQEAAPTQGMAQAQAQAHIPNQLEHREPAHAKATIILVVALAVIMIILLIVSVQMRTKHDREIKEDNFTFDMEDPAENVVDVYVQGKGNSASSREGDGGSSKRSLDSSHKTGSENNSRKGSRHGKKEVIDLIVINNEKGLFGLADLMKAAAEVLGNTGLGSSYKAMMSTGVAVVVKRIREMNGLDKGEFDAEIRRLGNLRHTNILTPLAYHYRKEEKLLVSEYLSKGSLLYVLHGDRGSNHSELNWPTRLRILKGIASGIQYLHNELSSYELPHGNLKSSNILLNGNYEPLLCDYGYYRMFTPDQAAQGMFACKAPEAVKRQQISPKCDVYCLGVVILELLTGKFPSQYRSGSGKGGTDVIQWVRSSIEEDKEAQILDPEIASSADSLDSMKRLLHIGAACCENDPDERPRLEEAVKTIEEIEA